MLHKEITMLRNPLTLIAGAALFAAASLHAQSAPASAPETAPQGAHHAAQAMPHAAKLSKAQKMKMAMSAGPMAIAKSAAVIDMTDMAKVETLREGTNGWNCYIMMMGKNYETMCLDKVWQKWADAWMGKKEFKTDETGVGYMLNGDHGVSNTDPWAEAKTADNNWVVAPPHVMLILPDPKLLDAYPTDWKGGGPWVMWKGTPYAHIMLPVSAQQTAK